MDQIESLEKTIHCGLNRCQQFFARLQQATMKIRSTGGAFFPQQVSDIKMAKKLAVSILFFLLSLQIAAEFYNYDKVDKFTSLKQTPPAYQIHAPYDPRFISEQEKALNPNLKKVNKYGIRQNQVPYLLFPLDGQVNVKEVKRICPISKVGLKAKLDFKVLQLSLQSCQMQKSTIQSIKGGRMQGHRINEGLKMKKSATKILKRRRNNYKRTNLVRWASLCEWSMQNEALDCWDRFQKEALQLKKEFEPHQKSKTEHLQHTK